MYPGMQFCFNKTRYNVKTLNIHYGVQQQRCAIEWHSNGVEPKICTNISAPSPSGRVYIIIPNYETNKLTTFSAERVICCPFDDISKTCSTVCVYLFSLMYSLSCHVYYVRNWWYIKPYCFYWSVYASTRVRKSSDHVYTKRQFKVHSIKTYFKVKSFVNQTNCCLKLISKKNGAK